MEKRFTLFLIMSLSTCNGDLGRLSGLLIGAHQQIQNKVQDVAGAVLGGFNLDVHGFVGQRRPPQPARPETVVVIVEGTDQGGQPPRPYGTPQQGQYQPNEHHTPNGYNQGYNQNTGYRPNYGYQQNNPRPNPPVNHGQGPYQTGQNNNNYADGNSQQPQNIPTYPDQYEQQNGQNYHENGQGNNNGHNNNVNPNNDGYGNPNNVMSNNLNPNGHVVTHPEQNKPNLNDNYKPTETYYNGQQHNDVHKAENTHKENNNKTTKKPDDDGPLFVPLNEYTYGGDKIDINPPKRDTDKKKEEESEEDFPIDIRYKDE